jgi:tight adherence protein C
MRALVAACAFLAASGAVYVACASWTERVTARGAMQVLRHYGTVDRRRPELLDPLRARLAATAGPPVVALARLLTPVGQVERIRRKLALAGRRRAKDLDRVLALRLVALAALPVWAVLGLAVLPVRGPTAVALLAALCVASALGPEAALDRRARARQQQIRLALPDLLDLLVVSVEAGMGLEQALDRVTSEMPGPLADELRRVLGDTRAGAGMVDALRALAARTAVVELRSFLFAIIQAQMFGTSIVPVLRAQAEDLRVKRRQFAQERAQKAPVKILVPMVFCIFPSILVVAVGPAAIRLARGL